VKKLYGKVFVIEAFEENRRCWRTVRHAAFESREEAEEICKVLQSRNDWHTKIRVARFVRAR
jgi:hypothetical protein